MPFLSSSSLCKRVKENQIKICPYDINRIESAAYELSMGKEAYLTTDETKRKYEKGEQVVIKPGQFAVLLTEEYLHIPKDLIAFISIKLRLKSRGLVNVSGFHVDPGFKGKLKFSVFNAGSKEIHLSVGTPSFQIWFSTLDGEEKAYEGEHGNQKTVSPSDVMKIKGEIASPSSLKKEILKLEDNLDKRFQELSGKLSTHDRIVAVLITLIISLIITIITFIATGSTPG